MSEVQKFEMLKVARRISRYPGLWIVGCVWMGIGFLEGLLNQGVTFRSLFVVGLVGMGLFYEWWAKRQPAKFLEMTEEMVRGPLGWSKWGEIPRDHVEEVMPTTEGLIIAWKKDGVPWYTEVMEMWFSATEWTKVRAALMA